MVPMRSVPHRVVCLVGLDDGVFPRQCAADGDDVLARDPLTGERDIRSEDRQLLLDAINAASSTSSSPTPASRLLRAAPASRRCRCCELLDALDGTTPSRVRDRVLTEHPLQPFDIRNFDRARSACRPAVHLRPLALARPAPPAGTASRSTLVPRTVAGAALTDVSVDDLVAFFKHPVNGFFRALDYTLPWDVDGSRTTSPSGWTRSRSGRSVSGCSTTCWRASPARRGPHGVSAWHRPTGKAGLDAGRRGASRATPSRRRPSVTAPASPTLDVDVEIDVGAASSAPSARSTSTGWCRPPTRTGPKHRRGVDQAARAEGRRARRGLDGLLFRTGAQSPVSGERALFAAPTIHGRAARPGRDLRRRPARAAAAAVEDVVRVGRMPDEHDPRDAADRGSGERLRRRGRRTRRTSACGRSSRRCPCYSGRHVPARSSTGSTPDSVRSRCGFGGRCSSPGAPVIPFASLAPCPHPQRRPCSRPVLAPARRLRWPASSPGTSPKALRRWTICC